MKAYTNLEQSKKLTEILSIESADMEYMFLKKDNSMVSRVPFIKDGYEEPDCPYNIIPCWSLSALFNIIPQEIFEGEYIINITEGCANKWILTYDCYEDRTKSYYGLSSSADNLVDACYELVLKLNERNLL